MIKTLPFEPRFNWNDFWNEVEQPCFVNEENQEHLWEQFMALTLPTDEVHVRE